MRKNYGITLVTLIIIVIILLILASVVTVSALSYIKDSADNKLYTELYEVQHAVLQQYELFQSTGNSKYIIGSSVSKSYVEGFIPNTISLVSNEDYYELTPGNLEQIGIKQSEDNYIINYVTGEVINKTTNKDSYGDTLYIRGKESI